jgi:hypothetical protein
MKKRVMTNNLNLVLTLQHKKTSLVDPDSMRSLDPDLNSQIRIQEGQNDTQK